MSETDSKEQDGGEVSVMRKMSSRRLVGSAKRMNPVLALKAALPKAAELELNMRLTVKETKEGVLETQTMMEAIPEDSLVTILAAKDGAQGLAAVDPQLLAALIETQTTGQISAIPAVVRPWTITDGQMCEPFIDRVFDMLELLLDADGRGPWFYGYRFLRKVNDRRKLAMTLEETRYLFYACKVELGDGAKTGMLWLALPDSVRSATTDGHVGPEHEDWQGGLRASVLESTVQLTAILHQARVPLSWLMSLKVGHRIDIPGPQIEALTVVDSGNRVVGTARLGQASGQRAIRMTSSRGENAGIRNTETTGFGVPVGDAQGALSNTALNPPSGLSLGLPPGGPVAGTQDASPMAALGGVPPELPGGLPDIGSNAGGLPDLPSLPGIAGDSAMPPAEMDFGLPDLPGGGGLPDLPAMAGGGEAGSDLPGLPDLSDLPDLPGLPPLPS